jgi:methyl-accepting chemotaxis protein
MNDTALFRGNFSRLKVRQKISLGFVVVLLLIAVLGVQFVRSVGTIDEHLNQVMSTGREAMETARLAQRSERLDRIVLNYIVLQTESSLADAQKELSDFETSLGKLGQLSEDDQTEGDVPKKLAIIRKAADDYRSAFNQIVAAVNTRLDGQKQTDLAGTQLNTTIMAVVGLALSKEEPAVQNDSLRLLQALQASRMATARYLTTSDPNEATTATNELSRAKEVITQITPAATNRRVKKFIDSMAPGMEGFSKGLEAVTQGNRALHSAQSDSRQALDALMAAVEAVVQTFGGAQHTAQSEARTVVDGGRTQAVIMPALGIGLGIVFAFLIGRSIARPVRALTEAMVTLASGDTGQAIPATERRDEIGDMARAVQVFKDNAIEVERLRTAHEQARDRAEADKRKAMNDLAQNFENTVMDVVHSVVREAEAVQVNAQTVDNISLKTREHATQGAAATEEASVNVNLVAAAVEQLTGSVASISSQVAESTSIAGSAVTEAQQTDHLVISLTEAATRIGDVVHLIQNIASQTNLLALNATIEAARAGDAGKGFAIVANEVKTLANQTSSATEDIGIQVEAIQSATQNAVGAIRHIADTIRRMNDIAGEISSAMEEQFEATREIGQSLQQAAVGTSDVARTITDVMHQVTESGSAADSLLGSAATLSQQTTILRNEVNAFTGRIRSA